jgi:serine/threonine-protein kinase
MPASDPLIKQTILHYHIQDKLGSGGMGVVYKAFDEKLQRMVALKFLPDDFGVDFTERDRLLREARAASALDHPNIGVIYDLEEYGAGKYFLSMGYYEGETLSDRLVRGTPSVREGVEIAIQIASGLAAAHARNIVHRDIKPGNIILTKNGDVKIIDFGLARVMEATNATITSAKSGTLPYMSPEQILGKPVDPAADVWALGVILTQLLTGIHPFYRESSVAMTFAILNQAPAGIEKVPLGLQPIVYRSLSKEKAHRYPAGREIQEDLKAAKAMLPVSGAEPRLGTGHPRAKTSRELNEIARYASKPIWTGAGKNRSWRAWLLAGVVVGTLLLASTMLLSDSLRMAISRIRVTSMPNHIAVLPFETTGNDPTNEAIAGGLMDSLTSKLSNLDAGQQALWVVPSSVVRSHKVTDPSAAARNLGVTLVVVGNFKQSGQDARLNINLIDAKNLRQIGSASLEDRAGNLETLQNDAVARIAEVLNLRKTPEMRRASVGESPPATYQMYLMALGYMQRYDKPGNLDLAISSLSTAVKADPTFAIGYAALGEAFRLKNQVDPNPKWIEQARSNLDRAVQLDDKLAGPYDSLGRLHSRLGQYDLAIQEFQKAVTINPRDPDALIGMAGAYERMSRAADAEATYKKAIALRPDYWDSYNSLGAFYDRQGKFSEAVAQYKKVIELTPDNAAAYSNLGAEYMSIGDSASNRLAEEALKKSIEIAPSYAAYANLGSFYFGLDRYNESAMLTRKALLLNDGDYRVWCNLLLAERNRGDEAGSREAKVRGEKLLEGHLRENPQDATALSWMAIFRSEEKQKDQALQLAESAVTIDPNDSLVLQNVAEAYENLGERSLALKYAEESINHGNSLNDLKSRPALRQMLTDKNFRPGGKNGSK